MTAAGSGVDWAPVAAELTAFEAGGHRLPVWWRDDDAVAPTSELDALLARASTAGAPISLAVIPAHVTAALADRVRSAPGVSVHVHGWAHENHAGPGEKKAEFGAQRPLETRLAATAEGRDRVLSLFDAAQVAPCFTPPWNRMAEDMLPALPAQGYRLVSTFTPRERRLAAPGLVRVNTHLDPIDFDGGARLKAPALLTRRIAAQLWNRRIALEGRGAAGRALSALGGAGAAKTRLKRAASTLKTATAPDPTEPYGLLTHHLVHDARIWAFVDEWLALLARFPAVAQWVDLADPRLCVDG